MRRFIPSSIKKIKDSDRAWFNGDCKIAVDKKKESFLIYTRNKTVDNRQYYVTMCNKCDSVIRQAKTKYDNIIKQKILGANKGSKSFWSFIGSVDRNFIKSSIPPLKDINGDSVSDPKQKADLFATMFAENSKLDDLGLNPPTFPEPILRMRRIYFRARAVLKVLKELDSDKAVGSDAIPAIVLKCCAESLCRPLCKLFYLSYSSGRFPIAWKVVMCSHFQKRVIKVNLRTIDQLPSLFTSILAKIMEKIINFKLMHFFRRQ